MQSNSKKQSQKKLWEKSLSLQIVKNNPILSVADIQIFFSLFCLYENGKNQCQVADILKTAVMMEFNSSHSIFYKCLVRINEENISRKFSFEDLITEVTDKLGNSRTQKGRINLFEILDLGDEKELKFSDLLKISDYLQFKLSNEEIHKIISTAVGENSSRRSITWDEFNSYMDKKLTKKKHKKSQ